MRWRPAQFLSRLGIGPRAILGHHRDEMFAGADPRDPARDSPRRLGLEHRGKRRQPIADRGRVVVYDVVEPGRASDDGERCRRRRIVDMEKLPRAAPVADHRHAPAPNLIDHWSVEQSRARPIEGAIA